MASDDPAPVVVSRRINAPAADIFRILADPRRHPELDGSGMVRESLSERPISGVGEMFEMKMYHSVLGHYEMNNHVVEYDPDRRLGWEPEVGRVHPSGGSPSSSKDRWRHRWTFDLVPDGPDATVVTEIYDCSLSPQDLRTAVEEGRVWVRSMTRTLERLDELCAGGRPSHR